MFYFYFFFFWVVVGGTGVLLRSMFGVRGVFCGRMKENKHEHKGVRRGEKMVGVGVLCSGGLCFLGVVWVSYMFYEGTVSST